MGSRALTMGQVVHYVSSDRIYPAFVLRVVNSQEADLQVLTEDGLLLLRNARQHPERKVGYWFWPDQI